MTRISDTEMTSDLTRHTAAPRANPGGAPLWAVTWLPGRLLTQNQAVTAMTIAEAVAAHADDLADNSSVYWTFIENWAAELGISGPHAVAEASLSPEDRVLFDRGRLDRELLEAGVVTAGGACAVQAWCEVDHGTGIVDHGGAFAGTILRGPDVVLESCVTSGASTGREPVIFVGRTDRLEVLVAVRAVMGGRLAELLEVLADAMPDEIRELAWKVRTAAEAAGK